MEHQRIGPDNTIGFGFSLPFRIFDRNQGEIARTQAEIARVDAVREATALQVLAALDTDLAAATTQRARVVMLRDTYLPRATQARDTVDYAYRRGEPVCSTFWTPGGATGKPRWLTCRPWRATCRPSTSSRPILAAHWESSMRAVLLSALIAAPVAACGNSSAASLAAAKSTAEMPAPAAPAAVVRVVSPEYKTRVTTLETTGKVQFNEEQLVRITAPVTGRVVEVLARPGEGAEPGRRLLVIDSSDLGAAKSDYAKAVSDAERAEHAIDLARDLFEAKALAQKEVRAAENDYRKAVAERERAASRLGTLGVAPTQLKAIASHADASTLVVVRAPRSGTIVERNISPGQVVSYGQSDTPLNLFVIADLNTMWVLADLYEPDVPRVHLGQGVSVTLPCCPGDRYRGTVVNIGDAIDKDSRTLKVRAVVPNGRRTLKAEMFVRVAIETGASRVLTLPQSAVQRRDGATFVLVETSPGEYQRRPITPGAEFDGLVEVREGVTPADRVVAAGGILLRQGGP